MVVLTIVTQKNGEPVYFDPPIPKVHFMKLLACSIYNSWDTLKEDGAAGFHTKSDTHRLQLFPNCRLAIIILMFWQKK